MLFAALAAASAHANDWGNFAIISNTLGNHAGRLCVGEGLRVSDIGCPTYAPSITTAGDVSITGNVSANKFIGDGSLLTGVGGGLGDRITSGTVSVTVNPSGYVSLSTGGTTWGYLNGLGSYLPQLTALQISASNVSSTQVELSSGTIANLGGPGGNFIASGTTSVSASSAGNIKFTTANNQRMLIDSSGRVGIGTASPGRLLELETTLPVIRLSDQDSAAGAATSYIEFYESGGTRTGYMGDSNATPHIYIASVSGSIIALSNLGTCTYSSGASWSCTSDLRLKDRVQPLQKSLEKIIQLQGVSYHWRKDNSVMKHIGLIAQDVQKVFPEVVSVDDASKMLTLDYSALISPMIEAIKELKAANDNFNSEHAKRLDALESDFRAFKTAQPSLVPDLISGIQELKREKDASDEAIKSTVEFIQIVRADNDNALQTLRGEIEHMRLELRDLKQAKHQ